MNKNGVALRFWLAGILVLSGVGLLVFLTARTSPADEVLVEQLVREPQRFDGRRVKVLGMVVEGSETYDAEKVDLKFRIRDREGLGSEIKVESRQPRPDAFKEGGDVIITGIYDAGTACLKSEDLMAKCPSRYEEAFDQEQAGKGKRPAGASAPGQP